MTLEKCISDEKPIRLILQTVTVVTRGKAKASGKHVHESITPHTPHLYGKHGVYRGIPIFLIFVPKHRLWVLDLGFNVQASAKVIWRRDYGV